MLVNTLNPCTLVFLLGTMSDFPLYPGHFGNCVIDGGSRLNLLFSQASATNASAGKKVPVLYCWIGLEVQAPEMGVP